MKRENLGPDYYQALHDNNPAFQTNNWLAQDLEELRQWGGRSLLELGCGNGRFLDVAAPHWESVMGADWAKSPLIDPILARHANVRFHQADVVQWAPSEKFDLVVSADFMEHLAPGMLGEAIARFHSYGHRHYHRIACYDDGHSHLSIFPPEKWQALFEAAAPGHYEILSSEARKGRADKLVITIGSRAALRRS